MGARPTASPSPTTSPSATAVAGSPTPSPTPIPTPSPEPTPTPSPTPKLVADPLTGRPVTEDVANRHVIAVMIDDLWPARPQSGLSSASVVWQAPAEGGIPRYMALFQDQIPGDVGPIRSARQYFIAWAAEWDAVYAHVGGSPQAMATLRQSGNGQLVYNADEFRWGGTYFWRIKTRSAPHNMYTDGKHLRRLAGLLGAKDGPMKPAWRFALDTPLVTRPVGGRIVVPYLANRIQYDYNRKTNTYLRTVSVEGKEKDAGTGKRVAPKNVIIMVVRFAPLGDKKHRLEADLIGSGPAWIATNGTTIKGTWKKKSLTAPTRFYDAKGKPVTLTIGQTFIQVVPTGTPITIKDGKVPPRSPIPSPRVIAI